MKNQDIDLSRINDEAKETEIDATDARIWMLKSTVRQLADAAKDADVLRERLNEAISYTETVDALLDGIIPARKDAKDPTSEHIYLKERVQMLIDQNEKAADMLSDCWMLLDRIARDDADFSTRREAVAMLRRHQCPGWKAKDMTDVEYAAFVERLVKTHELCAGCQRAFIPPTRSLCKSCAK